jgi:hypothetical protein
MTEPDRPEDKIVPAGTEWDAYEHEQRRRRAALDPPPTIGDSEAEVGRAALLLAEIVKTREAGDRDSLRGNDNESLLGAIEELEAAISSWRDWREAALHHVSADIRREFGFE